MTKPRKAHVQKRPTNKAIKLHKKLIPKDILPPPSNDTASIVEEETSLLINSPYGIFGPFLDLVITPWIMFFPFTPWPIKPVHELSVVKQFTGRV